MPWDVSKTAARPCYCGRQHCVETYLSGGGLMRTYTDLGGQAVAAVEDIVVSAAHGDSPAVDALECYALHFAHALATVVNILDPDTVVVGGGLSNLPGLCENVAKALSRHVFSEDIVTRVVPARHGDSSGVRGAAWLWD